MGLFYMKSKNPWFDYAKEDFSAMKALTGRGMVRSVLFHAQQIVEKGLKGMIYQRGENPPKTHDLTILLEQMKLTAVDVKLTSEDIQFLNSVYLETRYPPDLGLLPDGEPSGNDEEDAVRIAEIVHRLILSREPDE
jgi:HEPN domain-containing protein